MTRNSFLSHLFQPLHLALALSMLFSIGLLLFRYEWTGSKGYVFLVWNLFLAGIPLLAAVVLRWKQHQGMLNRVQLLFGVCAWLLFLPNAPYILTDLVHYRRTDNDLLYLDLMVILSFAWNGLLMGLVSIFYVQEVLDQRTEKHWPGWLVALGSITASGFGIYLGRVQRWNSWDLLTQPNRLADSIAETVANPQPLSVGFTVGFSGFLMMAYVTLRALMFASKQAGSGYPKA